MIEYNYKQNYEEIFKLNLQNKNLRKFKESLILAQDERWRYA
jgi:hypothetical protein